MITFAKYPVLVAHV